GIAQPAGDHSWPSSARRGASRIPPAARAPAARDGRRRAGVKRPRPRVRAVVTMPVRLRTGPIMRTMFFPRFLPLRAMLLLAGTCVAAPTPAVAPSSRAEATKMVADMRRVVTGNGVERLENVRIGGIEQWVSIRGNDRRNPVLLMLHGGPGWVAMPSSWYFQRGWEEYFTVVQWDQRGAGKTYVENGPAKLAPTMTRE